MRGNIPIPRADLVSHLDAPPGFLNITNPRENGFYLFGNDDFQVMEMRVAGILQRSMAGAHEDFILGVLCVMLIAILSDIIYGILMRTRERQVSPIGLHRAFVLDEIGHFRNVWALITGRRRSPRVRSVAMNSLIIVFLAIIILGADVLAVYLTQPVRVFTTKSQYNLQGIQPAGTSREISSWVKKTSTKKNCITPSMKNSNQSREYSITACIMRKEKRGLDELNAKADYVEVGSWYHRAGSNHQVIFGNATHSGRHSIETRATIMQSTKGITKGLLFRVNDTKDMDKAKYLQKYMLYSALEWNCDKGFVSAPCAGEVPKLQTETPQLIESKQTIVLWEKGEEDVTEEVEGAVTRFKIELQWPFMAVQEAMSVFGTSAVIEEVKGDGYYVDMDSGEEEFGIESLVSEEGRVAGMLLLGCILLVMLLVLVILRICLRPLSLAQIARDTIPDFDEPMGEEFVGAGPDGVEPRRRGRLWPGRTERASYDMEYFPEGSTEQGNRS